MEGEPVSGYKPRVALRLPLAFGALSIGWVPLAACGALPNVCGSKDEPELRLDGGVFSCLKAEDCPRPSNVFVCVTDAVAEKACVNCKQTECVRTVPVKCP